MRPKQPSLEQRGDEVDPRQQVVSQFVCGLDHFVVVSKSFQSTIPRPIVRLNTSPRFNGLWHGWLQTGCRRVRDSGLPNPPNLATFGLSRNQDQRLGCRAPSALAGPCGPPQQFTLCRMGLGTRGWGGMKREDRPGVAEGIRRAGVGTGHGCAHSHDGVCCCVPAGLSFWRWRAGRSPARAS